MSAPTPTEPPRLVEPWATAADLPTERPVLPGGDAAQEEGWERLLEHASEVLYLLSGQRYSGARPASVLIEARRGSLSPAGWDRSWGVCVEGGEVYNVCPCGGRAQVALPDRPVLAVTRVAINGEELPETAYDLVGDRYLRRLDGRRWETCRGDLVVDYTHGVIPPRTGVEAVVAFAVELGKLAAGDAASKITRKAQTITRQGVTVSGFDPNAYLDKGRTGVELADLFLAAIAAPPPRGGWVWSPDLDPYPSSHLPVPPTP